MLDTSDMDEIVYKIGGKERPHNNKALRLLFALNKIPMLRNFEFFKNYFCRNYGIPRSTSFNKNFYCSAPLLELGENVGLSDTYIVAYAPIQIGDNCSFSFRNMIITSIHDKDDFSTVIAKPVIIGNNVWVTSNVTILPGVTIGDNCIIGAGSVVTKSIPDNVFAAGNPCHIIKELKKRD